MKRPDVSTLVGVSLIAAGVFGGGWVLAGSPARGAGEVVTNGASTSASVVTASIAPRGGDPATTITAPLVATVGGGANSPAVATTPTPPALGNAGLFADFDGSQRVMPYALYEAIVESFPQSRIAEAIAVTKCETGGTWRADVVSVDGAEGSFQVLARYHGAVPADYAGQAQQAAAIVNKTGGWALWSCQP